MTTQHKAHRPDYARVWVRVDDHPDFRPDWYFGRVVGNDGETLTVSVLLLDPEHARAGLFPLGRRETLAFPVAELGRRVVSCVPQRRPTRTRSGRSRPHRA